MVAKIPGNHISLISKSLSINQTDTVAVYLIDSLRKE